MAINFRLLFVRWIIEKSSKHKCFLIYLSHEVVNILTLYWLRSLNHLFSQILNYLCSFRQPQDLNLSRIWFCLEEIASIILISILLIIFHKWIDRIFIITLCHIGLQCFITCTFFCMNTSLALASLLTI